MERTLLSDFDFFQQEVYRWLDDGKEGLHVLIKDQQLVTFCPSRSAALQLGYEYYGENPFFVHEVKVPTVGRVATARLTP